MADDSLKDTVLIRTVTNLLHDLSDLVQKEIRLARAELTQKVMGLLQQFQWMAVAGVLAFFAVFVLLEAIVFGLMAAGMPGHWACLLVACVLGAAAALAFSYGRSAGTEMTPTRTVRQLNEAMRTGREQLQ
jgi:uncharacterized membrane protein YqjE